MKLEVSPLGHKSENPLIKEVVALRPFVRDFCGSLLKGRSNIANLQEDMAQETLIRAIAKIDTFKGQSKLSTWLCSIARNVIISDLRIKPRHNLVAVDDLPSNKDGESVKIEGLHEPATNIEDNLILGLDLKNEINNLPEDVRKIVPMLIEGYSHEEIAKKVGIGVEALKSRLYRFRLEVKNKHKI
jgi:RNA polymerase sigma-70 factor (ECF subfamily)